MRGRRRGRGRQKSWIGMKPGKQGRLGKRGKREEVRGKLAAGRA